MNVDLWMTRDPLTIAPTTTISAAARLMARHRVRRLPVVDAERRLVGIVSAVDVARAFPPDLNPASVTVTDVSVPAPVSTIMSRRVRTIPAGAPMEDAARVLRTHKIGAVPVVRDSQLVGIVTESDLFRALVEMSDPSEAGVRVTFELDEGEDVVATLLQLCEGSGARIASLFALHHHDSRTGDRRRLGVLRLAGDVPESVIDAIWRSRHRVVSVMRLEERVDGEGLTAR